MTVAAATGSFISGMINAGEVGWADLGTLGPIAAAIVLYGVFVVVEHTIRTRNEYRGTSSSRWPT